MRKYNKKVMRESIARKQRISGERKCKQKV